MKWHLNQIVIKHVSYVFHNTYDKTIEMYIILLIKINIYAKIIIIKAIYHH